MKQRKNDTSLLKNDIKVNSNGKVYKKLKNNNEIGKKNISLLKNDIKVSNNNIISLTNYIRLCNKDKVYKELTNDNETQVK